MSKPWFRFYRRTVNNPKVQRLRPELFRAWVNILCSTDDEGRVPAINDLAFTLRIAEAKVRDMLASLVDAKLLRDFGAELIAHDWDEHNYESDADPTARDRKRKSRAKSRVTSDDGHAKDTRTDTDTDTDTESEEDTEQNRDSEPSLPVVGSARAKPKKGTRWESAFFQESWISDATESRRNASLPETDLRLEATKFDLFWSSKSGAGATKINWHKTWLNWALSAKGMGRNGTGFNNRPRGIGSTLERLGEEYRDAVAAEEVRQA